MALEKAFVPVDLSGGIDTKTDQKMVLPSSLTELENGVFTSGSTITKRKGYSKLGRQISGGSSISSGDALTRFQDELLLFSNSNLYSYSSGRDEWIDKGGSLSVTIGSTDLIRNNYEQSQPDVAYGNGLFLSAWEDTQGGVRASVVDAVSGAMIQNNTSISATGKLPRCVELDGRLGVVYVEDSDDDIDIRLLDNTDPTIFASAVQLASNAATSGQQLDVCTYNTRAAVFAYRNSSSQVQVAYISSSGEVGSASNGYVAPITIASDPKDSLAIFQDPYNDTDIYVAYSTDAGSVGLKLTRLIFDLTAVDTETIESGSTVIPRVTLSTDGTDIVCIYEMNATADYNHFLKTRTYDVSANGWKAVASVLKRSVGLASKAFYYNAKTYVVAVHGSDLQTTYFLMDNSGLVVAKMHSSVGGGILADSTLSSAVAANAGIYKVPLQIKTRLVSSENDLYSVKGLSFSSIDFTKSDSFLAEELGENLHIAGGFLSIYDSQDIVEHGFHLFPENVSAAVASGGSLTAGTYQYRVIYVTTDARGQIHRSAPSVAVSATTVSSNLTVNLTIPTLRITEHPSVTCEVYRTADAGTVFYKVGSVANDATADTVAFTDTGAIIASLASQEILYTDGGVVDNIAPPATSVVGAFNNRMFAVSSENPKLLYYSKKRQAKKPVEFSDVFQIVMNRADQVTALQEMDEKLIIFEEERIFYITGDGPNDAGQQNSFSEPQLVTSDVGALSSDAVVLTPEGIMFMSKKGIYLLSRGLQTTYIGAPVEAYNSETVTSAVLVQDTGQVQFTTSAGSALIYNLLYGKWSTWTNHAATGAVVWKANGSYCYLRTSGGLVYKEDPTTYRDVDASIQLKLTTAWIKPSSIQGFQRCRRAVLLGDYKTNHTLVSKVAYNFRQYYNEQHSFNFINATGVTEYGDDPTYGSVKYGGLSDGVFQFRMGLQNQKCDSIRFQFFDTTSSDPGQSYSITNLMLEIGLKSTPIKLPATKST